MNRTLIGALDVINTLLAVAIIILGAAAGYTSFPGDERLLGVILGLVGGVAAAAVVCGLLAILLEIESHLRQLVAARPAALSQPAERT